MVCLKGAICIGLDCVPFDGQAGQTTDDGLQLVVIGRLAGGDGQQFGERGVGLGQMAHAAFALGRQRRTKLGLKPEEKRA